MPEAREWRLLRAGLVVVDLAVYGVALILAAQLGEHVWPVAPHGTEHGAVTLLLLPVVPLVFASQGLYHRHNLLGGTREYAAVLRSCTGSLVLVIIAGFAIRLPVSREWVVTSWLLCTALTGGARFGVRRLVYRLRRHGLFVTRVLLLGADAQGVAMAHRFTQRPGGVELVGVLDDYLPVGARLAGGGRVLGTSARLTEMARRTRADEVIVVPQALPWESLQRLMAAGATPGGLRMHLLGGFYDLLTTGVQLSQRNGVPMLTIRKVTLTPGEAALKRALDLVVATALAVVFAPVIAVELGHRAVRGGRLLERRRVLDRRGRQVEVLGLPSPTLTGWSLVRKLPGLVNVLRGHLSMVGPHPIPALDGVAAGSEGRLTTLRPGLTGLWRQSDDPAEQLLLDMYYVRGYSIWFDLHILFERVKVRFGTLRVRAVASEPPRLLTSGRSADRGVGAEATATRLEEQGVM